MCERKPAIVAVTETWFTNNDMAARQECVPDGYKLLDHARAGRTGGGTALLYISNITVKKVNGNETKSFEFSEWIVTTSSSRFRVVIIYRIPYSSKHPVTVNTFMSEFSVFLESLVLCTEPVLICGDFNIHVNDKNDATAQAFLELITSMGLQQHVWFPTHKSGHTLDLIITRKTDSIIANNPVPGYFISDHVTIQCGLKMCKPNVVTKEISYRKVKAIDWDSFKRDLRSSELLQQTPIALDDLVTSYNSTLSNVLNKHAPVRTRTTVLRPLVPWFTEEIRASKRLRRRSERRWRKTKLSADFLIFKAAKNRTTYLMNLARKAYYINFVHENGNNQRKLFTATKKLLGTTNSSCFPPHKDKFELANDMGSFFIRKIDDIRTKLDSETDTDVDPSVALQSSNPPHSHSLALFCEFKSLTCDDVRELITSAPAKSSPLDPIPTFVIKECIDELLPILTAMINMSLQSGSFSDSWKEALIFPLLKKQGLDLIFNNFRPVCNLSYVSKLVERAVVHQTHEHLADNNLLPSFQSAYRKFHSTETALLKVKNDLLMNMDSQHCSLLVLLDLSAAFDTVDHSILLARLESDFGISGTVLKWFDSYLSTRTQRVSIDGVISDSLYVKYGVPQGSCLGPLLFVLYTSELFKIIDQYLPNAHSYADDTQLYVAFKPSSDLSQNAAVAAMESCITAIRSWMAKNKLKLNAHKTEIMIIGTWQQLRKVNIDQVIIDGSSVLPSNELRDLGVWFDSHLNMRSHVTHLCCSAFYYLYNIRKIRKYLSTQATETLIHSFVTTRIDYCNSLLYGLPQFLIDKLQRVHNTAARLVTNSHKFCHITPVLRDLHWLPVKFRIDFKILLLTFKCLHNSAPSYLRDLIKVRPKSKYELRSNEAVLLKPLKSKTSVTLGGRAFQSAAPVLWNNLPLALRKIDSLTTFKSALKSYLFKLAFK